MRVLLRSLDCQLPVTLALQNANAESSPVTESKSMKTIQVLFAAVLFASGCGVGKTLSPNAGPPDVQTCTGENGWQAVVEHTKCDSGPRYSAQVPDDRNDLSVAVPCSGHGTCVAQGGSPSSECLFTHRAVEPASCLEAGTAITLTSNGGLGVSELVTMGIPFPPGLLTDAGYVRILDDEGNEVPAYVRQTLTWHHDGSVRAVKVQFIVDMTLGVRVFAFEWGAPRTREMSERAYSDGTRPGREGYPVPKVLATLEPDWMTPSLLAGPQRAAGNSMYDQYILGQYNGWAKDTNYTEVAHWLFDRTSVIAKLYLRTGQPEILAEAFNSYRFYIDKIKTTGAAGWPQCGGGWEYQDKSPCDSKYVYPEAILLMLGLSGDDTQHDTEMVNLMAAAGQTGGWGTPIEPYDDPGTHFTERHAGLALTGSVVAYEITGERSHLDVVHAQIGYLYNHMFLNPDGFGVDGCWRHSWEVHESGPDAYPGNLANDRGCSPWMSGNLIGGLFRAYQVTQDKRIEEMILAFGRFLENHGFIRQAWFDATGNDWRHPCQDGDGTIAAYWSSSTASLQVLTNIQNSEGWYSDSHNPELLLAVKWAHKLETVPQHKAALADRIRLIENWFNADCAAISTTPRAFNWQHRDMFWIE